MFKHCKQCGELKLIEEFHKDKTKPDGHSPRCKKCHRYPGVIERAIEKENMRTSGMKKCPSCGEVKPIDDYVRDTTRPSGRHGHCSKCRISPETKEFNRLIRTGFKRCTRCNQIKPMSEFSKRRDRAIGIKPWCKDCMNIFGKDWKKKNEVHQEEYRRNRYSSNRAKFVQLARQYRTENKEKINGAARNYYRQNREICIARVHRRHTLGKEIYSPGFIYARLERQNHLCVYHSLNPDCQQDLNLGYEVDHILPISRGGRNDETNIQLLCRFCNRSKHNKTHEEYMDWLRIIKNC